MLPNLIIYLGFVQISAYACAMHTCYCHLLSLLVDAGSSTGTKSSYCNHCLNEQHNVNTLRMVSDVLTCPERKLSWKGWTRCSNITGKTLRKTLLNPCSREHNARQHSRTNHRPNSAQTPDKKNTISLLDGRWLDLLVRTAHQKPTENKECIHTWAKSSGKLTNIFNYT